MSIFKALPFILCLFFVQKIFAFGELEEESKFKPWVSISCSLIIPDQTPKSKNDISEVGSLEGLEAEVDVQGEIQEEPELELDHSRFIKLIIGDFIDGYPLISLIVDGSEVIKSIRQFKFERDRKNESIITSHFTWVTNIEPELSDSGLSFNRFISKADLKTSVLVEEGVDRLTYEISRFSFNGDSQNPSSTSKRYKYICDEPKLFEF